jgi:hypothetical protein
MQSNIELNPRQSKKPPRWGIKQVGSGLKYRLNKALGRKGIICSMRAGFGNQIFIYCFSRILAERYGLQMESFFNKRPVSDFTRNLNPSHRSHRQYALKNFFDVEDFVEGKTLSGKSMDIANYTVVEDWVPKRPINACGFFQNYKYYENYKKKIKFDWLKLQNIELPKIRRDTLCVHVRLGDYLVSRDGSWNLKFPFYKEAIESTKWRDVVIVTDSPKHEIINKLQETFGAGVVSNNWSDDFKFIMAHKKIVISDSSFSWWAAWLSDANEVISSGPNTDKKKYGGFWADCVDINLHCDEPRWRFIE